jgi:hypothetical protein
MHDMVLVLEHPDLHQASLVKRPHVLRRVLLPTGLGGCGRCAAARGG